nr:hypothetical protein [uncultured Desulfobacter sp.]
MGKKIVTNLGGRWVRRLWRSLGQSHRQILVSISSLVGSGLIAVAIRFVGSIIQARFVDPEVLGYYTKFTILPQYLFFLHLGVYTSFSRQYPYFIGKGEKETAIAYAANALGWTKLLCIVNSVIFFVPCLYCAFNGDWSASLGWGSQILFSVTSIYMVYLGFSYKNSSEFVIWSKATVISAVTSLFFLPIIAVFNFVGICMRSSLPQLFSTIYAHINRPLRIASHFEWQRLKEMIAFGLPLMIFTYTATNFWTAVERSYILKVLDNRSLGVFAFAVVLCAGLTTVANSISQVFRPRIAMVYGSSKKNMEVCFKYCMKASLVSFIAMLPLVILTYWFIDPIVRQFLPKYVDSISVVRCLCWMALVPVMDFPKQLLIVAKKTKQFGISIFSSFILFLGILAFFELVDKEVTLEKIAVASVSCKIISVGIANFFSWKNSKSPKAQC